MGNSNVFSYSMTRCFPFKLVDGHVLFRRKEGGYILLDTGSPLSFKTRSSELNIFFKTMPVQDNDALLNAVSMYLDKPVYMLLGGDILDNYDISISLLDELLLFMPRVGRSASYRGTWIDTGNIMGIPFFDLKANGRTLTAFFDTGAKISYITPELITRQEPVAKDVEDFSPIYGYFKTDLYRFEVNIAGTPLTLDFGVLPEAIRRVLRSTTGIESVVGSDLLRFFSMHISISGNFIILNPIEPVLPAFTKERWLQKFNATPSAYLLDSSIPEDLRPEFKGDTRLIEAVKDRMNRLSSGSTYAMLETLMRELNGGL